MAEATDLLARERAEKVLEDFADKATAETASAELKDVVAWAAISVGNDLSDAVEGADVEGADARFEAAEEKYKAALAIKPDKHEALNNWGNLLADRAKRAEAYAA